MEWKPASRSYSILNAPSAPFLVWGRRVNSSWSVLYLDMWMFLKILAKELKYESDDYIPKIMNAFGQDRGLNILVKTHDKNKKKWFFPVDHIAVFVAQLPTGFRPASITRDRIIHEVEEFYREEVKFCNVTKYGSDEDAEVADASSYSESDQEDDSAAKDPVIPNPGPVPVRQSKRIRERAQRSNVDSSQKAIDARNAKKFGLVENSGKPVDTSGKFDSVGKDKEEMDEEEEKRVYDLRPKRTKPDSVDIAGRMEEAYGAPAADQPVQETGYARVPGGTIYANSQEELAADAVRLVGLEDDVFDNEAPPLPEKGKEMEEDDDNDPPFEEDPIEEEVGDLPEDDEEYNFALGPSSAGKNKPRNGVKHVSVPLDQVEQRIRIESASIETLLLVASYAQDHHGHHRRSEDNPFSRTLDDIESHMVQAARRIMELAPASVAHSSVSIVAVEDADGTEVRMHEMAATLGLQWSSLSSDEQRKMARDVCDKHKQVYGVYPKKKRMVYAGGRTGMIYFYNQDTANACMKPVMEQFISDHVKKHAPPPGLSYFSK
jgi:hypothetical protein